MKRFVEGGGSAAGDAVAGQPGRLCDGNFFPVRVVDVFIDELDPQRRAFLVLRRR